MPQLVLTYESLIDINKNMFGEGLLKTAYHALSGALYVALALQDDQRIKAVERMAREQYQAVKNDFPRPYSPVEPTEAALYASLIEIAAIRSQLPKDELTPDTPRR